MASSHLNRYLHCPWRKGDPFLFHLKVEFRQSCQLLFGLDLFIDGVDIVGLDCFYARDVVGLVRLIFLAGRSILFSGGEAALHSS